MTTRILIAEDSTTTRQLLVALLRADPDVEIAGEATNGADAIEMTKSLRPHVVVMDVQMPRLDGFEATRRIMIEAPTPIVIVSASVDVSDVAVAMHALRVGAVAAIAKPGGPSTPTFDDDARRFVETVKAMAQVKVVRRWADRQPIAAPPMIQPAARP
jgi:two-component system chemotaxis response regulator CheB